MLVQVQASCAAAAVQVPHPRQVICKLHVEISRLLSCSNCF